MELDNIPGLKKSVARAQAREEELRDFAMAGVNVVLAGVHVRQMTLRHLLILLAAKNAFLCGGPVRVADVALFLWVLSPEFSIERKARVAFLERIVRRVRFEKAVRAIDKYVDEALIDRPTGASRNETAPMASFVATVIHEVASSHGWGRDEILDSPIAELYQYLRLIIRDDYLAKGLRPPPVFNRLSDKVRKDMTLAYLKKKKPKVRSTRTRKRGTKR